MFERRKKDHVLRRSLIMERRQFLAASCVTPLALAGSSVSGQAGGSVKQYLELRVYRFDSEAKSKSYVDHIDKVLIPALNRQGIKPVGVFTASQAENKKLSAEKAKSVYDYPHNLYVLLPHNSLESMAQSNTLLMSDEKYIKAAGMDLEAPKSEPAYLRVESSLFQSFDGIPKLEVPTKKATRVLQLRIYESHNDLMGKKKVHMFDVGGELDVFRETGLDPVFFYIIAI